MVTKHLLEAASLVGDTANADGTWKVRLISEGRGSSGVYTAALLENHFHAFDNVLSFRNHPQWFEGPETRDFTMIAGQIQGETWIERDDRGLVAIYGNYLPDEEYRSKLEQYKNKLGLSIYIEGSGYEDENGDFIVDWFNPEDPYASVDVVIAPGARGKFLESLKRSYEAAKAQDSKTSTTAVEERKEDNMEIADVVKAVEALADQVSALVAANDQKAEESAQRQADSKAVEAAVTAYDAAVKAIDEADLLKPQVESLRARAARGEDVAEAIAEAKAIKEAAIEAARVTEGATRDFGTVKDITFTGFGVK